MKKIAILFFVTLFFFVGIFTFAEEENAIISSGLQSELAGKEDDDLVEAIIRMKPLDKSLVMSARAERGRGGAIETMKIGTERSQASLKRDVEKIGGRVRNQFWIANAISVEMKAGDLKKISKREDVEMVHENFKVFPLNNFTPTNTEMISKQSGDTTWGVERIRAPEVWDIGFDGSGVKVAVLDTGIDITHPDLEGRMCGDPPYYEGCWAEFDSYGNEVNNSEPHDDDGHGTHVSGTVLGGNASGTHIGVAPGATLAHGLVLPPGEGFFEQVIAGMEWAIDDEESGGAEADIVNMSLGSDGYVEEFEEPIQNVISAGAVPVVATGNDDGSQGDGKIATPGAIFESFSIGASNSDDNIAGFSYGKIIDDDRDDTPDEYIKPDFSAPGVSVLSSVPGGLMYKHGTSMATPHVSGAIALIMQADPEINSDQIYELLRDNVAYYEDAGSSLDNGEDKNTRYGYGIIDVYGAISNLNINYLEIVSQPQNVTAGEIIDEVQVQLKDHSGESINEPGVEITTFLESEVEGAGLDGTTTKTTNEEGMVTFDDLSIEKAGEDYKLRVVADEFDFDVSEPFNVNAGEINYIEIIPQESTIDAGDSQSYIALGFDEYGNEAGEITSEVTWSDDTDEEDVWDGNTITIEKVGNWTITGEYEDEEENTFTDTATLEVIPGDVSYIEIIPQESTIDAGESQSYTAVGFDEQDNEIADVTSGTDWSDNVTPEESSTWSDEEVTIEKAGDWEITGTYTGLSDSATLTVNPASIDPEETTIEAEPTEVVADGESYSTITVQAKDEYGNNLETGGDEVSLTANFEEIEGVVDNDDGTYSAQLAWTVAETVDVTGQINGSAINDSASITFIPGEVDSVQISPSEDQEIVAGTTIEFEAEAHDQYGNLIEDDNEEFIWENADAGNFNQTIADSYSITATYEEVASSTVTVTVMPAEIDSIEISPEDSTIVAGDSQSYTATGFDEYGNETGDITSEVTWSDDVDPEESSTWSDEEVMIEKAGSWTITGEYEDEEENIFTDTATLTVDPGGVSYIEIFPQEAVVASGNSQSYTATGFDEYGNEAGEITSEVTWSDDTDEEDVWDGNTITIEKVGNWTITGEYEDEEISDSTTLETAAEPVLKTSEAVDVSYNSATLKGELTDIKEEENVDLFFEYGKSGEDKNKTEKETKTEPLEYFKQIESLSADTEYEFRAKLSWRGGSVAGETESFMTLSEPTPSGGGGGGGGSGATRYRIDISSRGEGSVEGSGRYSEGVKVTVKAFPEKGFYFAGWEENGRVISRDAEYTFKSEDNRALEAIFLEEGEEEKKRNILVEDVSTVKERLEKLEKEIEDIERRRVAAENLLNKIKNIEGGERAQEFIEDFLFSLREKEDNLKRERMEKEEIVERVTKINDLERRRNSLESAKKMISEFIPGMEEERRNRAKNFIEQVKRMKEDIENEIISLQNF